jgi:hypothetical protein
VRPFPRIEQQRTHHARHHKTHSPPSLLSAGGLDDIRVTGVGDSEHAHAEVLTTCRAQVNVVCGLGAGAEQWRCVSRVGSVARVLLVRLLYICSRATLFLIQSNAFPVTQLQLLGAQ